MKRSNRPVLSWLSKFGVAFRGIYWAVTQERSCWVHLAVTIAVAITGGVLGLSLTEWSILAALAALVWTAELLNTAIERLAEVVQPNHDPRIGAILDISAGAVLIAALAAAAIGAVLFLNRLIQLLS